MRQRTLDQDFSYRLPAPIWRLDSLDAQNDPHDHRYGSADRRGRQVARRCRRRDQGLHTAVSGIPGSARGRGRVA